MTSEREGEPGCPPPHFVVATARPSTPSKRSASARAAGARSIPVYDRGELARVGDPRGDRRRPAFDLAIRALPARRAAGRATARAGPDPARTRATARRSARPRRALPEARHREPDPLVQGPRRRRRRGEGPGGGPDDARLLLDRQPRQRRRRTGGRRRARSSRVLPRGPRAGEAGCDRRVRGDDLRGRRQLRRLQPVDDRAVVRAPVGVRQRRAAQLLRGGLEDARLRDRRTARAGRCRTSSSRRSRPARSTRS